MSHWHSGLPKLDLEPFDPTALYGAVKPTATADARAAERRQTRRPFVLGGMAVAMTVAVVSGLLFMFV